MISIFGQAAISQMIGWTQSGITILANDHPAITALFDNGALWPPDRVTVILWDETKPRFRSIRAFVDLEAAEGGSTFQRQAVEIDEPSAVSVA